MAKNEYRRALIMLRGLLRGYSGHIRLERRATTGKLDITVNGAAQGDTLRAALIGKRGKGVAAKDLGAFSRDSRGQLGLMAAIDPRNVAGMDVNDLIAAIICRQDDNGQTPALCGWINGAKELDWTVIRSLIDSLYAARETPSVQPGGEDDAPAEPETAVSDEEPVAPTPADQPEVIAETTIDTPRAAADLNIDMSLPWPEDIDDLRILFLTQPRYAPFEMEGYVFVRGAMPRETGISHCAVGIRAENGAPASVCYAIPMTYTAAPPAGLEEYMWIGDGNSGWWVTVADVGEMPIDEDCGETP